MNIGYQATSAVRTITAITFALLFSATCVMGAIAPAALQSAQTAGLVNEAPVA
ncbi:hypothetical protein [Sphingomonas sp. 28-63-12]|uniref:hypothetical protein n=1 Tax=Sphingomonas sp. 28-63-12 TaxID=1970434 RepID=UPI0035A96C10